MDENEVSTNEYVDNVGEGESEIVNENDEVSHEETATPEPTPSTLKKIKLLIDGQEIEEEVDEETLIKGYQHSKAAQKKFSEAAQMRKQAEMLVKVLQQDPARVLKEVGMDPYQWAEQLLIARLQEEQMDPKEKELLQYKKQLEALEAEKKSKAEQEQQAVYQKLVEHYQQDFEKQIIDTLNTSGLPRTEHTVARMAYYMQKALDAGLTEVTFADVIPLVKSDYENEVRSLFGSAPVEQLINLFGEESIKKIRSYEIDKIKGTQTVQGGKSTPKQPGDKQPTQPKKLTPDEWRAQLEKRVNSLSKGS